MMTTTLKPCPLCGAPFKMGQEPHDNGWVAGMYYIYHDYGPLGSPARKCPLEVHRHFDSAEEAARAWNSRPTQATDTQDSPKFNAVIHAREDAKRDTSTLRETVSMLAEQRRQNPTTDTQEPFAWANPKIVEQLAWAHNTTAYLQNEEDKFWSLALYTADQLDAAERRGQNMERERCALLARERANIANWLWNDNVDPTENMAIRDALYDLAAAIRKVDD